MTKETEAKLNISKFKIERIRVRFGILCSIIKQTKSKYFVMHRLVSMLISGM